MCIYDNGTYPSIIPNSAGDDSNHLFWKYEPEKKVYYTSTLTFGVAVSENSLKQLLLIRLLLK